MLKGQGFGGSVQQTDESEQLFELLMVDAGVPADQRALMHLALKSSEGKPIEQRLFMLQNLVPALSTTEKRNKAQEAEIDALLLKNPKLAESPTVRKLLRRE